MLSLFRLRFLMLFLLFCSTLQVGAQTVRPLDSLKQVFWALEIPADLQEEWIEALEKYEDKQDSPKFREALRIIDEELAHYLVAGRPESDQKDAKRKKKKGFLKKLGEGISNAADKVNRNINTAVPLEIAKAAEKNKNYEKAIEHYLMAAKELEALGKKEKALRWLEHVAVIYQEMHNPEKAIEQLEKLKLKMIAVNHLDHYGRIEEKIRVLTPEPEFTFGAPPKALPLPPPPPPASIESIEARSSEIVSTEIEIAKAEVNIEKIKKRAVKDIVEKQPARSQGLKNDLLAMQLTVEKQKKQMAENKADLAESRAQLLQRDAELAQQQAVLTEEKVFKRNLWIGLGLVAALALSLSYLYTSKRRDHQKLGTAYKELATAQSDLKNAEQRIKDLLKQQLSGAVANELISGGGIPKMEQRFVCIMFLDIRDFTPFVEKLSPEEIIDYQNNVLGFMIEKVIEHQGIVNTILGDGFMATFGAPTSSGNDCLQAHRAACEIMEMVKRKSDAGEIPPTKIGIGLHAGYVVAGNVGTKDRKQYSITGNPVIIASRLEQLNKEYHSTLIVSKEVFEQLPDEIEKPDKFDSVVVKGRSEPVEIARFS